MPEFSNRKQHFFTLGFLLFGLLRTLAQGETIVVGEASQNPGKQATLSGRVLDASNGEPVAGAVLQLKPSGDHAVTEANGRFRLIAPAGDYTLEISYLGYENFTANLRLRGDGERDFRLAEASVALEQITVTDTRSDGNVREVLPGVEQLSIVQMERQAKFLGETDVLRSLQSVSGVTSVGEGASGFNVRGGNTDENLMLMDGNLVFNPVHALGFFSLFHPDMVQGVTLYKGGVPSKYGGRLSSVLDVRLREGNDQRVSAKGGVGIATSRLVLEGPIVKNKASFIVGARASYVDWMLKQTNNVDLRKSEAFFYDLTAKADARLTKTTKFGFTAFNTHDDFQFADEVKFEYATTSANACLRQLIGEKINLTAQVNAGQYQSDLFDVNGNDQSQFTNKIEYLRGNLAAFFQVSAAYKIEAGAEQSRYRVSPGKLTPLEFSNVIADRLPTEQGHETSVYLHQQFAFGEKIEVMAGVRYTRFQNIGPEQVYLYEPGAPKSEETISDSLSFADGQETAAYSGFEPRFSLRVSTGENSSVKAGYNRSYQYLAQISNTASATPIDIWQLSNYHVEPQRADNFSVGYHHNFNENIDQTYLTVFYRRIENLIDYKDFARLLLNPHIETELAYGQGKAYGVEFYLKKNLQRHQFELNYTYSRTLRQVERTAGQAPVNRGDWYPSNYDKPHSFNLNYFWQIKPKSSLSVNFTYSTGRPTTAPVSSFSSGNVLTAPVYSERNQFRIPDYHRLDVAYSIGPWGKRAHWRNRLTLSIYNLYFRKNAFSVFFRQNPFQSVTAYRVAVLGSMFPAVTYDFEF
jgi:hypothetical protein